jgi:D-amino-acid dehydrogenase
MHISKMEKAESQSPPEVVVVGAGLAGLSVAHELAQRGRKVLVLDAGDAVAGQTSFANGGLLTPSMSDPWNAPGVHRHLLASLFDPHSAMKLRPSAIPSLFGWGLRFLANSRPEAHRRATLACFALAEYSMQVTRELRERHGLSYEASCKGTLKLFRSEAGVEGCLPVTEFLARHGLRYELLDRKGALAAEPQLAQIADEIHGAILYPDDESGDARLYCEALARSFEAAGGEIRLNTRVSRILTEGGAVAGVQTGKGPVRARAVVVAAAIASDSLTRDLGVRLPIRPAKGYSLTVELEDGPLPSLPVVDDALHAGISPLGAKLRVAGTAEFAGENLRLDPERVENLFALLGAVYPQQRARVRMQTARPWAGLRPMTSDGLPYVGPAPVGGLWVDAGHGHLGFTMAAGSARLLADLMDGRKPQIDPAPFAVTR